MLQLIIHERRIHEIFRDHLWCFSDQISGYIRVHLRQTDVRTSKTAAPNRRGFREKTAWRRYASKAIRFRE